MDQNEKIIPGGKTGFIPNPLPIPRKHEKREMNYDMEVPEALMHYDVEIHEADDFDL